MSSLVPGRTYVRLFCLETALKCHCSRLCPSHAQTPPLEVSLTSISDEYPFTSVKFQALYALISDAMLLYVDLPSSLFNISCSGSLALCIVVISDVSLLERMRDQITITTRESVGGMQIIQCKDRIRDWQPRVSLAYCNADQGHCQQVLATYLAESSFYVGF